MTLVTSSLAIAIAIVIYIYTIEVFTILFRTTGLTKEKARFQVISLITCAGFTTNEAEIITTNKKRRTLAIVCMITGTIFNVIIISFIINLISSFATNEVLNDQIVTIFIILGVAIAIIIFLKLPFIARLLEKVIEKIARFVIYRDKNSNVLTMLDSYGKNAIVEIYINNIPELLKNKTLAESNFKSQYNLNLLILKRRNRTIEITKDTVIQNKDEIVVFGNRQRIKDLFTYKINEQIDEEIIKPKENILTLIDNYGKDAMAEVAIYNLPEILDNKKLFESEIKTKYNLNILTIRRDERSVAVNKDTIIMNNDTIVVYGNYNNIKKVFLNEKSS